MHLLYSIGTPADFFNIINEFSYLITSLSKFLIISKKYLIGLGGDAVSNGLSVKGLQYTWFQMSAAQMLYVLFRS